MLSLCSRASRASQICSESIPVVAKLRSKGKRSGGQHYLDALGRTDKQVDARQWLENERFLALVYLVETGRVAAGR